MELEALRSGNDTGNTLWINQENMYIVDEQQVQNIYNKVNGLQAKSFEGMTIIDPALDIGDKIIINGKPVIYQGGLDFQGRFIANIKSKIALKQRQETTVKQVSQKVINRRVQSEINQIDGKITQLVEENTETSNKLTQHEQTIDSMKDTIKSQESKIETVETKANTANTIANNAKTKADSNATKIQTTITKLTEVEKTVDGITQSVNETKQTLEDNYSTTEETETKIQQASNSITTNVNKKITEIQVDADNLLLNTTLKKDASNFSLASGVTRVTDKLTPNNNYCFKYNITGLTVDGWRSANPTNVNLNAGEIVTASANVYIPSGVTNSTIKIEIQFFKVDGTRIKTFANAVDLTKTNIWQKVSVTGIAPAETIKANARVWVQRNGQCWVGDLKLGRGNTVTSWCPSSKDYPTTKEFGTLVEQNWEHVKVAWNTICEYLQLENLKGNASLVVRDGDGKLIMSLDKTGQHYWTQKNNVDKNIAETTLKDITINNQTKKALMFLLDNAEMNGEGIMAWGYKSGNNVYPVLYVGNFGNEEFGLHLATDLIAHANAIKFQNAQIDDDGANLYLRTLGALKIMDKENNTWIAQFFKDEGNYGFSIKADNFTVTDTLGRNVVITVYTDETGNKRMFFNGTIDNIENSLNSKMSNIDRLYSSYQNGYGVVGVYTKDGHCFSWVADDLTSDSRLKKNIKECSINALDRISKIKHKEFEWKNKEGKFDVGYIAQEMEDIDENYVHKIPNIGKNGQLDEDFTYQMNLLPILATTTKAVQELNEKVEKQDKLIKLLLEKLDMRGEDTNA